MGTPNTQTNRVLYGKVHTQKEGFFVFVFICFGWLVVWLFCFAFFQNLFKKMINSWTCEDSCNYFLRKYPTQLQWDWFPSPMHIYVSVNELDRIRCVRIKLESDQQTLATNKTPDFHSLCNTTEHISNLPLFTVWNS